MSIPNRAPTTIWCLRRDDLGAYVRTDDGDRIVIVGPNDLGRLVTVELARSDARLLAKRINECLDATVKR